MRTTSSTPNVEDAVRRLVRDRNLSYEEVAERVRQGIPGAQTSDRSVASTVSRLRKRGYDVPDRRYARHA